MKTPKPTSPPWKASTEPKVQAPHAGPAPPPTSHLTHPIRQLYPRKVQHHREDTFMTSYIWKNKISGNHRVLCLEEAEQIRSNPDSTARQAAYGWLEGLGAFPRGRPPDSGLPSILLRPSRLERQADRGPHRQQLPAAPMEQPRRILHRPAVAHHSAAAQR